MIQIGNQRDELELYLPMQQAQEELATEQGDIVLVSRQFKTFAAKGLMKDRFHYLQKKPNRKTVGQFFYFYTVSVILRRYRTSAVSAGRITSSRSSGAAGARFARKARMAE